mmetsp:Transcript_13113/g.27497  ORF Transcript_13113/g.27497 Transcript_13113/m.27497 type:complete len:213 (-) Transcript_13113:123-761(-)
MLRSPRRLRASARARSTVVVLSAVALLATLYSGASFAPGWKLRSARSRPLVAMRSGKDPLPAYTGDKPQHAILEGATPLMEAAFAGEAAKVDELIKAGADVNGQDGYGWTAFRYAVRNNKLEAAKTLLNAGADMNIASKTGRTPLMSVASNGLEEMCRLMMDSGDVDIMASDKEGRTAYECAVHAGDRQNAYIAEVVSAGQTPGTAQYQRTR